MTMKTTFDLPEALVHEVKRIARERGTTAREIVQQALVRVVDEHEAVEPFALEDVSVPGWGSRSEHARAMSVNDMIVASYDFSTDAGTDPNYGGIPT